MSFKDGRDYLYLVWKSEQSRKQYIVGSLTRNGQYEFRYSDEVREAIADGFSPLLCFQELEKVYVAEKLFPVFSSRLPDKKRKDIQSILDKYGLDEYDEYMLLKRSGGRLPIDNLEFIDPILNIQEHIKRIFFLAGVRHYLGCQGDKCKDAINVVRGDEIFLRKEPDNQYDKNAVQVVDAFGNVLGYIPRYYSKSVSEILESGKKISCHIYNVDKNKNCHECIKAIMELSD